MLKIAGVSKSYGNTVACKNIDVIVNTGEFFTLLGPSGCGKTTLLRLIAGLISPDEGRLYLNEKDITDIPTERRRIGLVFQNYALFPHLNVHDNIAYGLKTAGKQRKDIDYKVQEYLDLVNLVGYGSRKIPELSGGEQQRVALARALIVAPEVLLLDEPLSNLDAMLKVKMRQELKSIQERLGITTIFVTHDQQEALTISDRIAVFNQGECLQVGTPNEIYQNPNSRFIAEFIGEMNWFERDQLPSGEENTHLKQLVALRPQDIRILRDPLGDGVIMSKNIVGTMIDYQVNYRGQILKVVALNRADRNEDHKPGERVKITLDLANAQYFESE